VGFTTPTFTPFTAMVVGLIAQTWHPVVARWDADAA
jgi:hypothetical protein